MQLYYTAKSYLLEKIIEDLADLLELYGRFPG